MSQGKKILMVTFFFISGQLLNTYPGTFYNYEPLHIKVAADTTSSEGIGFQCDEGILVKLY